MNDNKYEILSQKACQLSSMTSMLTEYCERFYDKSKEHAKLIEFTKAMRKKADEIFEMV